MKNRGICVRNSFLAQFSCQLLPACRRPTAMSIVIDTAWSAVTIDKSAAEGGMR